MAYRSSAYLTGASTSGGGANVPVPASAAIDDIAVVGFYLEATAAITPPTGFTQKVDLQTGTPSTVGRLTIFWKRLIAADSGTWTFTYTANGIWREAASGLWSGRITTGDPFDLTSTNEVTATTTVTCTALSPAASGDDLVGFATSFTGGAWTPPSGMSERQDTAADVTLDTIDNISSGTTGNKTFTCAGSGGMKGFIGALLPASAPAAAGEQPFVVPSLAAIQASNF